jgi:hypothetical protein
METTVPIVGNNLIGFDFIDQIFDFPLFPGDELSNIGRLINNASPNGFPIGDIHIVQVVNLILGAIHLNPFQGFSIGPPNDFMSFFSVTIGQSSRTSSVSKSPIQGRKKYFHAGLLEWIASFVGSIAVRFFVAFSATAEVG